MKSKTSGEQLTRLFNDIKNLDKRTKKYEEASNMETNKEAQSIIYNCVSQMLDGIIINEAENILIEHYCQRVLLYIYFDNDPSPNIDPVDVQLVLRSFKSPTDDTFVANLVSEAVKSVTYFNSGQTKTKRTSIGPSNFLFPENLPQDSIYFMLGAIEYCIEYINDIIDWTYDKYDPDLPWSKYTRI